MALRTRKTSFRRPGYGSHRTRACGRYGIREARRSRRARHADEVSRSHGWGFETPAQADELLMKQLVLGLPEPLRDVFVLSRFGGLSNSQIGEQLGISPKTVEWRMTKALAHCAAQLRR